MSINSNQNPTAVYAAVPMPNFSVSPVKDFFFKAALFLMASSAFILTGLIAWNEIGGKGGTTPPNPPNPPVVVNPTPVNPLPGPQPLPGPSPVPTPNPNPPPLAASVTLANPGMNVVRLSVGDKLSAVIVNVVPAGTPLANPNDIYPGTYPVTATVDGP